MSTIHKDRDDTSIKPDLHTLAAEIDLLKIKLHWNERREIKNSNTFFRGTKDIITQLRVIVV